MPVEVELPDGSIAEFPEDMAQDKISEAIQSHLGKQEADAIQPFGGAGTTTMPSHQKPERILPIPQSTADVFTRDLFGAAGKGLANATGSLLEGMAASGTANVRPPYTGPTRFGIPIPQTPADIKSLETDKTATMKAVQDDPFYSAGQFLRKTASNIEAPADSLLNKAVESGAGMLPLVASGPLAPATIGLSSYGETLDDQYQQSKDAGLSDEDAATKAIGSASKAGLMQAAIWEVLPGPLKKLLGKATGVVGEGAVKQFVARRAAGTAEGAALGAASQAGGNVATGQPVGQNVVPAAVGMAGLGAVSMGPERTPVPDVIAKAQSVGLPEAAKAAQENLPLKSSEESKPDYQYASSESQSWWEKRDELQNNLDRLKSDESTRGTPERKAARKALQEHDDLAYEGDKSLAKSRIDKNDPLKLVNATTTQYDTLGQLNLTGWKFSGDWTKYEDGRFFRKVVSPDGTKSAVVWKETIHPLQEEVLNKNSTTKVSNASEIEEAATVHGDVPTQPPGGEGQVPKQGGGEGVQPSGEELEAPADVVLTPPKIEGTRFLGESKSPRFPKGLWQFEADFGNGVRPAFSISVGATEAEIRAKIEAKRAEYGLTKPAETGLTPVIRFTEEDSGKVRYFSGNNHGEAVQSSAREGFHEGLDEGTHERGFLYKGKFLNRSEAAKIFEEQHGGTPAKPGELHSGDLANAGLKVDLQQPAPDWTVAVTPANGEDPGHVQITDNKSTGKPPTVESLKAAGHDVPDFSQLPKGRYTWQQAEKMLSEQAKSKEVVSGAKEKEKAQGNVLTTAAGGEAPPAVPQRYKIGKSPQTYVEVDRPVATDLEKSLGEQPVRVKNEKTGEVQTVKESDLTAVKSGEKATKTTPQPQPIGAGPGAATRPGAVLPTDIGAMESNIPPLEKLADAVKRFPKQSGGGFREKLRQWMDDVGIPTKDLATRALIGAKAAIARIVDLWDTSREKVTTMDRAVGDWNLADTEGDIAARRFAKAVKDRFPDRSKLRAFSNWINAGGDKKLLQRQADLTKDPELKKTYTDALNFGPEEEKLGADIKQYFDEMLAEAMRSGSLEEGLENYIHRYYPREDDPARQRLEGALNEMRFTKNFSGFKRRFYDSDFEAEQAGLKPEKDAAKRILAYDQGFRKALTARAFVKDRYAATMPDGRPEIDVTGVGVPSRTNAETGKESPYLVKPKSKAGGDSPQDYRGDYVTFDHPAFRRWKWVGQDANGKPILMEGEMSVHPDAVKKYRALFERSWFQKNPLGKALLAPSHFVKQTMLALSAFHPVQIGIHAIEHKVNPFNLAELNTRDPAQAELIKGGLTVSDLDAGSHFSEGVAGSGLFGKIPIAGEMIKATQDWLFKDFIPRIKMTMALDALERNRKTYAKDLASGKITDEQLVRLTARESNAAFGEQNYRAMFRHKGFQDVLRFAFLAPDFGEARLRFPLQAMTKYGGEQRMALTLGAVGMFVAAKTAEKLLTGKMNLNKPFTVTKDNREYGLRNVSSDLYHMITDPSGYLRNRLNPIYTRPALEMLSGRDAFGRKRSGKQQVLDEAKQIVPISGRGLFEKDQSLWESFINALGLTEHRASAFGQAMKAVNAWKEKKGYTEPGEFVYDADKDPYSKLTTALTYGSPGDARKQLDALTEGKSPLEGRKIAQHYRRSLAEHPYLTGSRAHEQEYVKSLDAAGKAAYDEAKAERRTMWQKFVKAWRSKYPAPQQ